MLALLGHLIRLLLLLPLLLGGALVVLLVVSLEAQPLVGSHPPLGPLDVARARQILKRNALRPLDQGDEAALELTAADLNLVAGYAVHRLMEADTRLTLAPQTLSGELTWKAPSNPIDPYLNLTWQVQERNGEPRLTRLQIGRLELPVDSDATWLADVILHLLGREAPPLILSGLRRVTLQADRLTLVYRWDPQLIDHALGLAFTLAQRAAVEIYYRELGWVLARRPQTLTELLPPLFRLAVERSVSSDPLAENRAVLEALGLYGLGQGLDVLGVQGTSTLGAPWVTLQGREDLTRHYLISAAASAGGNRRLADAIGLFKEWRDAQGGSGFSFVDLAADRAGTRLGERAVTSPELARKVQQHIAEGLRDEELLPPPVLDLPEGMSDRQFADRFGGIGEARYQQMRAAIERHLDALPLYYLH